MPLKNACAFTSSALRPRRRSGDEHKRKIKSVASGDSSDCGGMCSEFSQLMTYTEGDKNRQICSDVCLRTNDFQDFVWPCSPFAVFRQRYLHETVVNRRAFHTKSRRHSTNRTAVCSHYELTPRALYNLVCRLVSAPGTVDAHADAVFRAQPVLCPRLHPPKVPLNLAAHVRLLQLKF